MWRRPTLNCDNSGSWGRADEDEDNDEDEDINTDEDEDKDIGESEEK